MSEAAARVVLVVDDEDDIADALEMVLEVDGYRTVRARDGVHALELVPVVDPDLMLLDMNMPRLDGFGVLQALPRARRRFPIIALSAFHSFLPKALELGAALALPKPFELAELRQAVTRALAGAREEPAATRVEPPPLVGLFEDERVARLQCLAIMEPSTDECLDRLVRITADLMRTPMALVSIITADRQWWKAMHGMRAELAQARGTPRDQSMCIHAVAARAPLVVNDARAHPVFAENRLVKAGVLNAYAGVPIEVPGVGALGTLCVLDEQSRAFTAIDLQLLAMLAERVAAEIDWRERHRAPDRPLGTFTYLSYVDERHGIYNDAAFRSLLTTVARMALLEARTFGVIVFGWPERGGAGPAGDLEAGIGVAVRAIRNVTRDRLIVGRFGERGVAALLPHDSPNTVRSVLAAVTAEEERLRTIHPSAGTLRAPIVAAEALGGSVDGRSAFAALDAALRSRDDG